MEDRALSARMGDAGRARVREFDARKMVSDIATLYESLLAEERP
jgi:hypothetical protein